MNSKDCKLLKCLVNFLPPPCKNMVRLKSTEKWLTGECCILFRYKGELSITTRVVSIPFTFEHSIRDSHGTQSLPHLQFIITSFLPYINSWCLWLTQLCPMSMPETLSTSLSPQPLSLLTLHQVKPSFNSRQRCGTQGMQGPALTHCHNVSVLCLYHFSNEDIEEQRF